MDEPSEHLLVTFSHFLRALKADSSGNNFLNVVYTAAARGHLYFWAKLKVKG